jgi:[NiFe] hydrogenase assembly HybE family chaperone
MPPLGPMGPPDAEQAAWVQMLVARYAETARTRMAGLPVCHPALSVAAVGFQRWATEAATETAKGQTAAGDGPEVSSGLLGVLLTPWFMNLVWRPDPGTASAPDWLVGVSRELAIGPQRLGFLGAHEPDLGGFASCSLISPLFQFADQTAALATAQAVVDTLSQDAQAARSALATTRHAAASEPRMPARRGFLLGRTTPATGPRP